jgi:hypothetical protein
MTKLFIATDYNDSVRDDDIDNHRLIAGATELKAAETYGRLMSKAPKFVYEIVNKKQVTIQTPKYGFVEE